MTKTKFSLVALALVVTAAAVLAGCFKNGDNTSTPLTQKQTYLVQKAWTIKSITVPSTANPAVDSSIYQTCHAQALVLFGQPVYTDGSGDFGFYDRAGACDSNAFHYGEGRWLFTAAEDTMLTINLSLEKKVRPMKIVSLTDSVFQVKFYDTMRNVPNILKTITFVH